METQEKINIICSQTNYTINEATQKLDEFNNNIENVISDYLGINKDKKKENKSVNQMIYKEIRNLMDTSIKDFEKK
tara:strand:+ start:92 stop:319 length:228 start_codon:yes stop_codon:yes gene_type:complete